MVNCHRIRILVCCLLVAGVLTAAADVSAFEAAEPRIARLSDVPLPKTDEPAGVQGPVLQLVRQQVEDLEINRSVIGTPLKIGQQRFERGLGTHSVG